MKHNWQCIENVYTSDQIKNILEKIELKKTDWDTSFGAENVRRKANTFRFIFGDLKEELNDLKNAALFCNKSTFGLDLFEISDLTPLILNHYHNSYEGEYDWHIDFVYQEPYDMKLTVLMNVSQEPYEGGEFSLFHNGEERVDLLDKTGSILVFPSWIPHRVLPVTSGIRQTIAMFLTGPSLK